MRLLLAVVCLLVPSAWAGQMFETPQGIVIRSLAGQYQEAEEEFDRGAGAVSASEHVFTRDELCRKQLRHRRAGGNWQELDRLCLPQKKVSFLFLSDTQTDHDTHARTARIAKHWIRRDASIQFVLHGGDLVSGGSDQEYLQYRRAAELYSTEVPIVPVVGNHEYYGDPTLSRRKALYGHDSTAGGYYTLDYGLFSLVVLNSNLRLMGKVAAAAQTRWLEKTLSALHQQGKTILVAMHHPGHSSGYGLVWMYWDPRYIRKNWEPLFEKYGVRLMLTGHEHIYERLQVGSCPMLVAGAAGGNMSRMRRWPSSYSVFRAPQHRTLTRVEVDQSGTVRLETWDTINGKWLDRATYPQRGTEKASSWRLRDASTDLASTSLSH